MTAPIAATKIQAASGHSASASVSATAGSAIVVGGNTFNGSANLTVTRGTETYTCDVVGSNGAGERNGIASAPNVQGGSVSMTVSYATGVSITAWAVEFAAPSSAILDGTPPAVHTGSSTTGSTNSYTNSTADAIYFAFCGQGTTSATVGVPTNSFTDVVGGTTMQETSSSFDPCDFAWLVVSSAASRSCSFTVSSSSGWAANLAAYKITVSGGGTTPSSTDSATLAESVAIALNGPSDASSLAEQLAIALGNADTAGLSEQMKIALGTNDTATLQELVAIALAATDSASSTEQTSVSAQVSSSDSATVANSESVGQSGSSPSGSEGGSATESASVGAAISATDAAALAEQAAIALGAADAAALAEQIKLGLLVVDNAALVEQLQVAVASSASDILAYAEVQSIVATLTAIDTSTLTESASVSVFNPANDSLYVFGAPQAKWAFSSPSSRWTFGQPQD